MTGALLALLTPKVHQCFSGFLEIWKKTVAGPGGRVLDFISAVPGWQEKEERARYFEKQTLDNYTTQRPSPRPRPLELVEDLFRGVALQLPQEMSALGICVGPRPQACSHLPTPSAPSLTPLQNLHKKTLPSHIFRKTIMASTEARM